MSSRATRQYLESLQRAGVTHLPTVTLPTASAVPAKQAPTPKAVQPTPIAPPKQAPAEPAVQKVAEAIAPPPVVSAALPKLADGATIEQKQAALMEVASHVAACVKCQELANTRKQTVFGVGNPDAKILFIGEAPGADEDRQGEPFVGRAGQLLNDIINACKMQREDIYICNILRCRPPGNRNPSPIEAGNCREFLDAQISIVQPEYIVCWGSVAAHNLLGDDSVSIGRMRGNFYQYGDAKVVCTYHPSYLLRNPSAKKNVWADMKFLFADMGVQL